MRLEGGTGATRLTLAGGWLQADGLPDAAQAAAGLARGATLAVSAGGVERWDTTLAAYLDSLGRAVAARGAHMQLTDAPDGMLRLLRLVGGGAGTAVVQGGQATGAAPAGEKPGGAQAAEAQPAVARPGAAQSVDPQAAAGPARSLRARIGGVLAAAGRPLARIGPRIMAWGELAGRIAASLVRLATGRARVPWSDVLEQFVECGPRALPIVTLLSFLIGAITAFVGVVQLRVFNAELYVADLVGMGMLLEMGALMTGIIMAGRAGAAFAAALGTMQTNEEVDALATLGLDPVEFLVVPRVLALAVMTPLLTLYADLVGIAGGGAVAALMLDMSPATYFGEVAEAIELSYAVKGLLKSFAFGVAIGFAGCLRGIESGRSAQAVGRSTTSAVVTSIVLLVLLDAFMTTLYFVYDGQL